MFDEKRSPSPEQLAQIQAEGFEPAPAEWLDRQMWSAKTSGRVDMLCDPVKAAREYKRMQNAERERERYFRYARGMPPLPEEMRK